MIANDTDGRKRTGRRTDAEQHTNGSFDTTTESEDGGGDDPTDPPFCGAIDCTDSAVRVVNHPRVGRFVGCDRHASDFPIIEVLADAGGENE